MQPLIIKNRRLKVSPGGIATLPVSARKALGMTPNIGTKVTMAQEGRAVTVKPAGGPGGTRVSPKGQIELRGDMLNILQSGVNRHFWLEIHDDEKLVILRPSE